MEKSKGLPLFLLENPEAFEWGEDVVRVIIAAKDEAEARKMAAEVEGFDVTNATCEHIGYSLLIEPKVMVECGA